MQQQQGKSRALKRFSHHWQIMCLFVCVAVYCTRLRGSLENLSDDKGSNLLCTPAPQNIKLSFSIWWRGELRSAVAWLHRRNQLKWFPQHDARGMKDNSSDCNILISISQASALCSAYARLGVFIDRHSCKLLRSNRSMNGGLGRSQCGFYWSCFTKGDSIL